MPTGAAEPTDPKDRASLAGLRVFISYPRGGAAHSWARRIHTELSARGAVVWRDETGVAAGDPDWYAAIRDGLERSDVALGVFGHDSERCRWQQREMLRADDLGLPVVAALLAGAGMPFYAQEREAIGLQEGTASAAVLDALAGAVARHAPARPPAADPAQPVPPEQRHTEQAWLNTLLHRRLTLPDEAYEPLAYRQQDAALGDRLQPLLRFDHRLLLSLAGQAPDGPDASAAAGEAAVARGDAPQTFDDVLDAYRRLPQRELPRIVVLGEPGAGKSFSLERIAREHARRALHDPAAPLPVLLRLGLWTRDEPFEVFAEQQIDRSDDNQRTGMGRWWSALRDQRRAVLLLDGLNEIPPPQRAHKAEELRRVCQDARWVAVAVSCRQRDYVADFHFPFDRLTLQPLTPPQVYRCLQRAYALAGGGARAAERAERRFWEIAGGDALRDTWQVWRAAGASFEAFWTLDEVPHAAPDVYSKTSGEQNRLWREARQDRRSLLRLAANPYLLSMMVPLTTLPSSRAQMFEAFLAMLHEREAVARRARGEADGVPDLQAWLHTLTRLAENLQHLGPVDAKGDADAREAMVGAATTSLPRGNWPAGTAELLDFSRDASVLQLAGEDLRFTHQLLQEALASRALRQACADGVPARVFWPAHRWWQRNGWEVVAEIAIDSLGHDTAAAVRLIGWLAEANPEVALEAWRRAGEPALPAEVLHTTAEQWCPRLADAAIEPLPLARAAIGRWLGVLGLDRRPGIGLGADGLPDIDWVHIETPQGFVYQRHRHPSLPAFDIARYPVTHRQFQAFIDAGGYAAGAPWWDGLAEHVVAPAAGVWTEPNAPRERVSWYEAVAFCRWLSAAIGQDIRLPTEHQWERAASGTDGLEYPWGDGWIAGAANCCEVTIDGLPVRVEVGRTTAVGLYPLTCAEGAADLAGNVWEWCLNDWENPENLGVSGEASRVLRGGSWDDNTQDLRAAFRLHGRPGDRGGDIGFRVYRVAPIETRAAGALDAGPLAR